MTKSLNEAIKKVLKIKVVDFKAGVLSKAKRDAVATVEAVEDLEILTYKDDSVQGYVTVCNHATGKTVVISKNYGGKTSLFDGYKGLDDSEEHFNEVMKGFDFVGYLGV